MPDPAGYTLPGRRFAGHLDLSGRAITAPWLRVSCPGKRGQAMRHATLCTTPCRAPGSGHAATLPDSLPGNEA
jgi:hypothetical protein